MSGGNDDRSERRAAAFEELVGIIHRLRAPGGCPWDRAQTPATLKPFVIEEAYEVIDAIDGGCQAEICEELGDLLLQVVLQAEIADEADEFNICDVITGISRKLVHRHPHVFGDVEAPTASEVLVNWEQLKKQEKRDRGLFDGLPAELPALQRAARMGEKAGRVGFDWPGLAEVRRKVSEELEELDQAIANGSPEEVDDELGDLLFASAQLGRHLSRAPEESLRAACARFSIRFSRMESILVASGKAVSECGPQELDDAWEGAKRALEER